MRDLQRQVNMAMQEQEDRLSNILKEPAVKKSDQQLVDNLKQQVVDLQLQFKSNMVLNSIRIMDQ